MPARPWASCMPEQYTYIQVDEACATYMHPYASDTGPIPRVRFCCASCGACGHTHDLMFFVFCCSLMRDLRSGPRAFVSTGSDAAATSAAAEPLPLPLPLGLAVGLQYGSKHTSLSEWARALTCCGWGAEPRCLSKSRGLSAAAKTHCD